VRHAFRLTFAISAVVAAVLSNDAAILLLTPTTIALLRAVDPRRKRNPKFLSNPMNTVPVAIAGWLMRCARTRSPRSRAFRCGPSRPHALH
jgi:Na+/H+ antiporter NhaD/arsenite permease-like protein